ncbi:hypothetical protein GGH91_001398 [Coemansia sp. RSA 2671]|nr:hypothetical protein LPJ60_000042 [Coemansia sp. RSA 2675]KAJ2031795.1 hypothetical protein IWW57_000541 [Coemansia sp. S610]KAJ2348398.1 hypothetical protein GGH91_001398 [Coemansia sp. RSA 2671]
MDGFGYQLQADAAEAEGCLPQSSSTEADSLPSLSTMFGFAANWGKKLQNDLQIGQLVDQVKKQSEEVTKAYSQDITEFAQAVKVGATRGIDELSTRFTQMKTELKEDDSERSVPEDGGLFGELGRRLQPASLKQQQETAKRLMSRLGADLEDLWREAIVIEAPGSTEEQRSAARKIVYDRRMAQLAAIQESADTYLVDPRGLVNTGFMEFIGEFSLDNKQSEVEALLRESPAVAQMHKDLVPEKVAEAEFWTRYFYQAWMVDQEEDRRKKLVEAAVASAVEEEFSWDIDEDEASPVTAEKPAEETAVEAVVEEKPAETTASTDAPASDKPKEEDDAWDEWE